MSPWERKLSPAGQRAVATLRRDVEQWRDRAEQAEAKIGRSWNAVHDAEEIVERQNRCIGKIATALIALGKHGREKLHIQRKSHD